MANVTKKHEIEALFLLAIQKPKHNTMPTRQAGGFRKRPITHIGCEGDPTPLICPPEVFLLVEEGDVAECVEGRATYSFTITNAETEIIAGNALALTWLLDGSPLDVVATNATFTEDTAFTTIEADGTELNVTDTWAAGQTVTVTVTIDNTDCEDLQIITLTAIGIPPLSEINQADNTAESTFVPLGLRLTFTHGNLPANNLAAWNSLFDLPTNGTAFTSLSTSGDEVTLIGGSGITLKQSLFRTSSTLLKIEDDVDCVVAIAGGRDSGAVSLCSALTTVTLNGVITVAEEGLLNNPLLTSLSLNDCTTIGGNGLAFNDAIATLTLPSVTSIGNGGMLGLSALTTFSSSTLLTAGINAFNLNTNLVSLNLPNLTTLGNNAMFSCVSVTLINIPLCVNLGTDPSDAYVFDQILGQTLTLNIAAVNATNNGGGVHASVAHLIANNTATVNYI